MHKKSKFSRDFGHVIGNPFSTDVIWCPKSRKGVKIVPVSWCYITLFVCVRAGVCVCVGWGGGYVKELVSRSCGFVPSPILPLSTATAAVISCLLAVLIYKTVPTFDTGSC